MQIGPTTSSIKNDFSIHNECSVSVEDKWNQLYYKKYNVFLKDYYLIFITNGKLQS